MLGRLSPVILCIIHTAAPTGLDIVVDEQSYVTITWEPPRLARRHGKLLNYSITCSTTHSGSTLTTVTLNTTLEMQLKPYETYQCCVSAVNQMGSGFPSCKLIETNEGGKLKIICYVFMHAVVINNILFLSQHLLLPLLISDGLC